MNCRMILIYFLSCFSLVDCLIDLIRSSPWLPVGSGQIQTPGMFHYNSHKLAETNEKIGQ